MKIQASRMRPHSSTKSAALAARASVCERAGSELRSCCQSMGASLLLIQKHQPRGRCSAASNVERELLVVALAPQPHDDVDARDLVAFGRLRHLAEHHLGIWDIDDGVGVFEEEVM